MNRARLYVDVTTNLQERGRHPHGTTRVSGGIVSALAEMDRPDIAFFAYGRGAGRFDIVSRDEILALSAAPVPPDVHRAVAPRWRQTRLAGLARAIKRSIRERRRGEPSPAATIAAPPEPDIFEPGSTLLFPGEHDRQDFGRLKRLRDTQQVDLVFVFYDLLQVLADDDPRLADPSASDLPGSDFIAREAALALAISRFSAGELARHLARRGAKAPEIRVIRLAGSFRPPGGPVRPVAGLRQKEFILAVGDVVLRKNHALLARVWKALLSAGIAVPNLVIAGRVDPECFEFVRAIRSDDVLGNRFIFLPNIADDELAWLYANCRFTVFPSRLEGFGLPVAESLGHGRLCVSSSASAVPEAGQGYAIELDPDDDPAWIDTIAALCRDDERLARHEAEISAGFARVTWHDTAGDILAAIEAARRNRCADQST